MNDIGLQYWLFLRPIGIHFPVLIAIFPNYLVLQHLRMYLYPMDILSLAPIVESANAHTGQQ